jgi:hypothetical protein
MVREDIGNLAPPRGGNVMNIVGATALSSIPVIGLAMAARL